MLVRKDSPARLGKVSIPKSPSHIKHTIQTEGHTQRLKSKDKREKRRNRSKSKDNRHSKDNEFTERLESQDEEDVFGLNNLRDKLINKKKKRPTDNVSMPTGTVGQDVLEQQEQMIRILTAQLEKERKRGKQILKALHLVNMDIEKEKQYLKIQSRVK